MSAEPPVPPKTPLVPPVVVAYAFAFGLCVLAVLAGVVCRVMLGPSPFMALAAAALPLLGAHYLLVSNVLRGKSLGLRFGASLGTLAAAGGITAGLFYVLFEPTALVWNNYPNFFWMFFLSTVLVCEGLRVITRRPPANMPPPGAGPENETAA